MINADDAGAADAHLYPPIGGVAPRVAERLNPPGAREIR
jgi:hypothetical protein